MFGKKKERKFWGMSAVDLDNLEYALAGLCYDISLTEKEKDAIQRAMYCVAEIKVQIESGKKVRWDA